MHTGIDLFFKKFIILLAEKSKITADLPEVRKNEKRNAYNRYPGGAYHFMDNRDYRNEKNIAPAERRDRYRLFSFKIENRSDHNAMPRRSARFFYCKNAKGAAARQVCQSCGACAINRQLRTCIARNLLKKGWREAVHFPDSALYPPTKTAPAP